MKDVISLWLWDHGFLRLLYRNLHRLPGNLYRCNQPSPSQLRADQKKLGIKTVVNLRGGNPNDGFFRLEKSACQELSLQLQNVEIWSRGLLFKNQIEDLKTLIETMELPALAHCKSGADRAGLFSVFYRHFRLGEPIEVAVQELDWKYGHFKGAQTGVLDHLFSVYMAERQAHQSFIEWVKTDYRRDQTERAFTPKGMVAWFVDAVLRRE